MNQRNVCSLALLALSLATPALAVDPASLLRAGFSHAANPFATSKMTVPAASPSVYHFASVDYPGAEASFVFDANNNTAVGITEFTSSAVSALTLSGGVYQLFTVPGSLSEAGITGINTSGEMVGVYNNTSDVVLGFLYNGGTYTSVNELTGSTTPYGINKSGEIVGSWVDPSNVTHGFYTNKKGTAFTNFDFPGSTSTTATGINTAGVIVGQWTDSSMKTHGFMLSGGVYTSIDFPGAVDPIGTIAFGINDNNDIAGYYSDASMITHGFIYSAGNYSTVDVAGAAGTELTRIKNNGQITGVYIDGMGEIHGVTGQ